MKVITQIGASSRRRSFGMSGHLNSFTPAMRKYTVETALMPNPKDRRARPIPMIRPLRHGRRRTHERALAGSAAARNIALDVVHLPQFDGLGFSMSRLYAIRAAKAEAYLNHPVLVAAGRVPKQPPIEGRSHEVFGCPDDLKLRSSRPLFVCVSPLIANDRLLAGH